MTIHTVFFGSSSFSLPFLEWCYKNTSLKAIVTFPDTTQKRGLKRLANPVKELATSLSIPVLTPTHLKESALANQLQDFQASVFITASYGKIIPKEILQIPSLFSLNIHPSLLPDYRGADPLFWQIVHQVKKTGVTIFQMLPSLDNGPILEQKTFPLQETDTYHSFEKKAIHCGLELLETLFHKIQNQHPLNPVQQPSQCSSYARKRTSRDEQIQWASSTKAIDAFIRAFPSDIGAYTWLDGKRVKILEASPGQIANHQKPSPGHITIHEKNVYVASQDGYIQLLTVKVEGKSTMSAKDFLNGYLRKSHDSFFSFHE
ncbi:MAG: methionyl-tRNA formyltransferase [Caldisericia bacterium]|nr:methionyl-tRNA formyltransferase [Caldisericia bacterium]MDD4613880.1 methionyl-tRNA formyltransferase [Caldisericia bacterium]